MYAIRGPQAEWTPPLQGFGMPQTEWAQSFRTQLEYGTKLVRVSQGYWGLSLFPDAGEGVAVLHSADATATAGAGGDSEE